eukprot:gene14547-17195_t
METIPIVGAVTTICQFLDMQSRRCAGMTMLGKTVELCHEMLETCNASTLDDLRARLTSMESCFEYDVEYIMKTMKWTPVPS